MENSQCTGMDVSIIIVNYNTRDLLKQCVDSIFRYSIDLNFEIIVVDNASADGSTEMIKTEYPKVILIESKVNLGFGKANNLGAKQASGTYLFLLNSDTILIENSCKILKEYLENINDPNIAVAGCNMLDINRKTDVSYGNFPSLTQEAFEYGLSKIFRHYYLYQLSPAVRDSGQVIKSVDYIRGAAMFFKKNIFDENNGFDEKFFLYYEETELCFRLKKLGYQIMWNPNTSIIHYEGASGRTNDGINYWILEQFYKSKYLYFKKCHGQFIAIIVLLVSIPKVLIINRKLDVVRILKILLLPLKWEYAIIKNKDE